MSSELKRLFVSVSSTRTRVLTSSVALLSVAVIPLVVGLHVLGLWDWDLTIPMVYLKYGGDETWQLALSKALIDTGWVLNNPYLGAPDVAHWHNNSAAQASALHSVIMLSLSSLVGDAVKMQQVYYLLNFSLISLTSFWACRLLGISIVPASSIGILYSLISYRFNFIIYSFLSNYFVVPLVLVPIFWIMMGEFSNRHVGETATSSVASVVKGLIKSRKFLLGLVFIVLIASADGYYAFFTLLLLGFATFIRAVSGDWRHPTNFLVPAIYVLALICVSFALMWPIAEYKRQHREEFFPNGVEDPALVKHSFEAEVYSTSLKLLLSPGPNHRNKSLADLGKKMLETSDAAREFKVGSRPVKLGILGAMLFAGALLLVAVPAWRANRQTGDGREGTDIGILQENDVLWVAASLALFIFLCSIAGGVGTLIALIYPTIRAYDRFALFLLFVLYLGAGVAVTSALSHTYGKRRGLLIVAVVGVTAFSLYDQIPGDAAKVTAEVRTRFLAEREFVRALEASVPQGSMVYQYPHSQYLVKSPYYGWGAWGHIRLYLHAHGLRWSNGASKNSPVDDWHMRLSRLPIDRLIVEVAGSGFDAFVVDRTVVRGEEYARIRQALINRTDTPLIEDEASDLAFAKLSNPGYRLFYDASYRNAERLVISDSSLMGKRDLPRVINAVALAEVLRNNAGKTSMVIEKAIYPSVFADASALERGTGDSPITVPSDMKGEVLCEHDSEGVSENASDVLVLKIRNLSDFDWQFNAGRFPLGIGFHLLDRDGSVLRWDDGLRLPTDVYIVRNSSAEIRLPLDGLNLKASVGAQRAVYVEFAVVQDGNRWFGDLACRVTLRR